MKRNVVWVVEIKYMNKWEPCNDAQITKRYGFEKAKEWRSACPDDKFRVTKYAAVDK